MDGLVRITARPTSEPRVLRRRRWGPWLYKPSTGVLLYEPTGYYWIALDDCKSDQRLANWVRHLNNKRWVTPEVMGYFVQAVCEIHHWQAW